VRDPNALCKMAVKDLWFRKVQLLNSAPPPPINNRTNPFAVGGARAGVGAEGGGDRR
jgi:hypothetical protein